ncbi:hypothetical protein F4821DRAFT_277950 [Hypoxylon rubiginosum]|uniref:Uncharacterized protein n=1 Tax=Hypoxylon rubiginosum TaxID=110542 RepID=A0ACC0DJM5_9PEZI|nr:hypothetical protein F4821DRAFT_277950 [Hypoxylon rubiginosum]
MITYSATPNPLMPGYIDITMPTRIPERDAEAIKNVAAEAECQAITHQGSGPDAGVEVPEFPRGEEVSLEDKKQIKLQDLDASNRVPVEESEIIFLTELIGQIKSKPAADVAKGGAVFSFERSGRLFESFVVKGLGVAKYTFKEVDVEEEGCRPYADLAIAKEYEEHITTLMGVDKPDLEVEQRVAANILLASGGNIESHPGGFWPGVRDVAQRELWRVPGLASLTRAQISQSPDDVLAQSDPNLLAMLKIVRACLSQSAANPWHQAARNEFAAHSVYEYIDADVFLALDKNGKVIAFRLKDAFTYLFDVSVQARVTQALDTYTTLHPIPAPDETHGLHHHDWVSRVRPDLNPRSNPNSDTVKCGTWTIGMQSASQDPSSDDPPCEVLDIAYRGSDEDNKQLRHVRLSVLGSCTAVADYYLDLLDPDLRKQLVKVSEAVYRHHPRSPNLVFKTRPDEEPFTYRSVGINTKRYEDDAKDEGSWERGLGATIPLGHFEGGDLLLRELGVRVSCPPGSIQILRNNELRYSTTAFSGKRFEVSHYTPEGVHRWAEDRMADQLSWGEAEGLDEMLMNTYFDDTDDHQQQAQEGDDDTQEAFTGQDQGQPQFSNIPEFNYQVYAPSVNSNPSEEKTKEEDMNWHEHLRKVAERVNKWMEDVPSELPDERPLEDDYYDY